jgi:hypothetical protein
MMMFRTLSTAHWTLPSLEAESVKLKLAQGDQGQGHFSPIIMHAMHWRAIHHVHVCWGAMNVASCTQVFWSINLVWFTKVSIGNYTYQLFPSVDPVLDLQTLI